MPLFEYTCMDCGKTCEILIMDAKDTPRCTACGGENLHKLMSAHAAHSISPNQSLPGPGDTTCCGASPMESNCAGPGSCCGKGPAH